jgi:hypothetical protein
VVGIYISSLSSVVFVDVVNIDDGGPVRDSLSPGCLLEKQAQALVFVFVLVFFNDKISGV